MSALSPVSEPTPDLRSAGPLTPLDSALTSCCLSYKQSAPISPLEFALTNASHLLDSAHLKTPCFDTLAHISPTSPLESALTKTPGGWGALTSWCPLCLRGNRILFALCFHILTNCFSHKPFIFTTIRIARGCGGPAVSDVQTCRPSDVQMRRPHPKCLYGTLRKEGRCVRLSRSRRRSSPRNSRSA